MAEEMNRMGEQMPAQDQRSLRADMPEEARENLMSSSEEIKDVLMMRLTEMSSEELQQLDKAITPDVIDVLLKLLPELKMLIDAVGGMEQKQEDEMMPKEMGALGNM